MESRNQTVDAALEAWNELCLALKTACMARKLEFRQPENLGLLIQQKEPPRALRLEYSPKLKKVRDNTVITGWQELNAIDRGEQPIVFQTPYYQQYSVQELCELVLGLLKKSPV
jgi:hypothetical protein